MIDLRLCRGPSRIIIDVPSDVQPRSQKTRGYLLGFWTLARGPYFGSKARRVPVPSARPRCTLRRMPRMLLYARHWAAQRASVESALQVIRPLSARDSLLTDESP